MRKFLLIAAVLIPTQSFAWTHFYNSGAKPTNGTLMNPSDSLSQGLVIYLPMNEGYGNTNFDSRGYANGTLTGGAAWVPTIRGEGVTFPSNSAYVNLGAKGSALLSKNASAWTIVATFITSTLPSLSQVLVGSSLASSDRTYMEIQTAALNTGVFNGASFKGAFNAPMNPNTFYQVVFTQNGTAYTFYVNGKQITQSGGGPITDSGFTCRIGNGQNVGSNYWFLGQFLDFRIYNRPLSSSEVSQLWMNPYRIFSTPKFSFIQPPAATATTSTLGTLTIFKNGIGSIIYHMQ